MSKYSMYQTRKDTNKEKEQIHPIWRGIGCILLILIPVISYITADYLVTNRDNLSWVIISENLIVKNLPDPYILEKLLYTAIFVFVLYLILTIITFFMNKFLGPSRYGPYDVPLDHVKRK
jgi:hypothetical protein